MKKFHCYSFDIKKVLIGVSGVGRLKKRENRRKRRRHRKRKRKRRRKEKKKQRRKTMGVRNRFLLAYPFFIS